MYHIYGFFFFTLAVSRSYWGLILFEKLKEAVAREKEKVRRHRDRLNVNGKFRKPVTENQQDMTFLLLFFFF